jgi:broad specificity phosphatase PhoE
MPSRTLSTRAVRRAGRLSRTLAAAVVALATLAVASPIAARAQSPAGSTVIVVTRHAERADGGASMGNDPPLSEAGTRRAAALAQSLEKLGVSAVYTTQYKRTKETAQPAATALGLAITERPATAANQASYAQDLAKEILAKHAGQVVLVVGHSNTVPAIVGAFGIAGVAPIPDSDYGDLFVVVVPPAGAARLLKSRVADAPK